MLDEMLERVLDVSLERFSRWSAPWKVRFKRSGVGFRLALIWESMTRTAALLFDKIKVAGSEGGILQRLISEPVEPVEETTLLEMLDRAFSRAQAFLKGKAFAALLLMM